MPIASRGCFPFELDRHPERALITAHAGVPVVLETWRASGAGDVLDRLLPGKRKGLPPSHLVESALALLLAGGDTVEDLELLRRDAALSLLLGFSLPAAQTFRDFLETFHQPHAPLLWQGPKAAIPGEGERLEALRQANARLIAFARQHFVPTTAALWSICTLRGVWFSVRSPDHGADDADEEGWMEGAAVIAALSRKRAEIAGRREAVMAELAALDGALAHLDGAMGLFTMGDGAPADRRAVAPPRHLPGVRPGETARLALEVLRTAAAPMTAQDLARALCANREAVADEATVGRVSNALVMALHGYEKRGVVTAVGRTALRAVLWRVAGDQAA